MVADVCNDSYGEQSKVYCSAQSEDYWLILQFSTLAEAKCKLDCSPGFVTCKFEFCSNSECRGECYCEDSQNERLDCKENDNFGKLTPFGGMGQDDIPVQLNTPKIGNFCRTLGNHLVKKKLQQIFEKTWLDKPWVAGTLGSCWWIWLLLE